MTATPAIVTVDDYDELCAARDFNILVVSSAVRDPALPLLSEPFGSGPADVRPWSEALPYGIQGWSDLNEQHQRLSDFYDRLALGASALVSVRDMVSARAANSLLAQAVCYSRHWLGEAWPDDDDLDYVGAAYVPEGDPETARSFLFHGVYKYRSSPEFVGNFCGGGSFSLPSMSPLAPRGPVRGDFQRAKKGASSRGSRNPGR